jgi:hypothetical protein
VVHLGAFNVEDANHHVVRWNSDPDYLTQVNYLRKTPCLLEVGPEIGPDKSIAPGETFQSFRTFVMPYDSYDRERQGLALRKMYRTLAPWTTENPLMMHARFADWDKVQTAIDQAADVGFEMVILTFGSGFDIEDDSEEYLEKMTQYAEYAGSKGVEIGGYSLLASRTIGHGQDVIMPPGENPTFGNSPCIGSEWGQDYFQKLYNFYQKTGFALLEHDGSYPGDVCISEEHPGHKGYQDSRWEQYATISNFYRWCRSQGIYLNIPDYYYMTGGSKCGMGYREVNWSLARHEKAAAAGRGEHRLGDERHAHASDRRIEGVAAVCENLGGRVGGQRVARRDDAVSLAHAELPKAKRERGQASREPQTIMAGTLPGHDNLSA